MPTVPERGRGAVQRGRRRRPGPSVHQRWRRVRAARAAVRRYRVARRSTPFVSGNHAVPHTDGQCSDAALLPCQWPRLIVPLISADEASVCRLITRWTMMVPETLANRPVPPVISWVSVVVTVGNVTIPSPITFVKISSSFAAVHVAVPDAVAVGGTPGVTSNADVKVKRPKCVAWPLPTRLCRVPSTVSVASRVPRNGKSDPPLASVTAASPSELNGDVGAVGASPAHAAAKIANPTIAYRIVSPPESECTSWNRLAIISIASIPADGERRIVFDFCGTAQAQRRRVGDGLQAPPTGATSSAQQPYCKDSNPGVSPNIARQSYAP